MACKSSRQPRSGFASIPRQLNSFSISQELLSVTRIVAVPKTKIVKQEPQQQTPPKDTERTNFTLIRPQPPLPNQQHDRDKR